MKLGLIADVHEDVSRLRVALDRLGRLEAERLIVLGDVFDQGPDMDETTALLDEAGAIGVWGNHDAGFCLGAPVEGLRERYAPRTIEYMGGLLPRLEIEGCHISHIEPWLDPWSLEDLWWAGGYPDTPDRVSRIFDAVPHRLILIGHIHRWIAAKSGEVLDWKGDRPLWMNPAERYFVGVHAVADGWAALLDTTANVLTPIPLDSPEGANSA
ncbi:MAG: metallophosphoesterase [Isosphaeraceae bacterium]